VIYVAGTGSHFVIMEEFFNPVEGSKNNLFALRAEAVKSNLFIIDPALLSYD